MIHDPDHQSCFSSIRDAGDAAMRRAALRIFLRSGRAYSPDFRPCDVDDSTIIFFR